jgi:hypothetical protein
MASASPSSYCVYDLAKPDSSCMSCRVRGAPCGDCNACSAIIGNPAKYGLVGTVVHQEGQWSLLPEQQSVLSGENKENIDPNGPKGLAAAPTELSSSDLENGISGIIRCAEEAGHTGVVWCPLSTSVEEHPNLNPKGREPHSPQCNQTCEDFVDHARHDCCLVCHPAGKGL